MELNEILTIGVTSHNHNVQPQILNFLKSLKYAQAIISEDGDGGEYEGIRTVFTIGGNTGKNRQNLLNHVSTKYVFLSDADDNILSFNEERTLISLLSKDDDVIYNKIAREDGNPTTNWSQFFNTPYVTCWSQIFKTDFIKKYMMPTWNGYSEEVPVYLRIQKEHNFSTSEIDSLVYQYVGGHTTNIDMFDFKGMFNFLSQYKYADTNFFREVLRQVTENFIWNLPDQFSNKREIEPAVLKFLEVLHRIAMY